MNKIIKQILDENIDDIIKHRRHIHQNPETGWNENETSKYIFNILQSYGLAPEYLTPTGVSVEIKSTNNSQKTIAFRADIDALPFPELSDLPFKSTNPNASHLCGHDVHTAIVLGVAKILSELQAKDMLQNNIKLIFQPAEELIPGGAEHMIDTTDFLNGVDEIYALHVEPKLDVGKIGLRIGAITSATDVINVTLNGKGGHTSRPYLAGDMLYALGKVITDLPAIYQRHFDYRSVVNITWGAVKAGLTPNAIPSKAKLKGTLRTPDLDAWKMAPDVIPNFISQIVAPYEITADVEYIIGDPPVVNTADETNKIRKYATDLIGDENIVESEQSLGGEDFAWYLRKVKGSMLRLGVHTPGGNAYDLHRGDLVIDEKAIPLAIELFANIAID
ncbi:MAG: amidohydrolase [Bifidobacteriaceae bacterium]|jgi:amidohydrolase|nr:amidohydrolase [Bifidobacteriaceae bacterium]